MWTYCNMLQRTWTAKVSDTNDEVLKWINEGRQLVVIAEKRQQNTQYHLVQLITDGNVDSKRRKWRKNPM